MKQKIIFLLLIVSAIIFCSSCEKGNNPSITKKKISHGIYMAGQRADQLKSLAVSGQNSSGCIWVNGKQYDMGDVWIDDVKVFNDTIYACGHSFPGNRMAACYFIGDQKINFNVSNGGSDINSIWVQGGNVYVAGQDSTKPCYWVNGVKHNLPSEGIGGSVNKIVIKNGNIYCSGNRAPFYIRGCYWINDERHDLEDIRPRGGNTSWASAMFIIGSDVFISGSCEGNKGYDEACYWKNGIKQNLSFADMESLNNTVNGDVQISEADDIYFYNGDIYVSGRYVFGDLSQNYQRIGMCYWKNSSRVDITSFQDYVRPQLVVDDTAVYFIADTTFWINNRQVPIENQQNYTITSIYRYEE